MKPTSHGLVKTIGGKQVDLNSGLVDAALNPLPEGYSPARPHDPSDLAPRLKNIPWFSACGAAPPIFSFPIKSAGDWNNAANLLATRNWESACAEAQAQLTLFLHRHHMERYRSWNTIVLRFKSELVTPLSRAVIEPFACEHGLSAEFGHSVRWNVLHALVENAYLDTGFSGGFFLDLLSVYEAGHLPCGWSGRWPHGKAFVL